MMVYQMVLNDGFQRSTHFGYTLSLDVKASNVRTEALVISTSVHFFN